MVMNRQQRVEFAQRIVERFRELKEDEGWTQETLSAESGVKIRTVSDVLRGVSVPNDATCRKLGAAMGIMATANDVTARLRKYESFLDVIALYLEARPESEHDEIKQRVFEALFPSDG
jgi:transcriptional regulator with XRE-family HTH domain